MKIIFLDIDGVLNDNGCKTLTSSGSLFVNDNKIKILKEIIDRYMEIWLETARTRFK